jgi:hypothetical protein
MWPNSLTSRLLELGACHASLAGKLAVYTPSKTLRPASLLHIDVSLRGKVSSTFPTGELAVVRSPKFSRIWDVRWIRLTWREFLKSISNDQVSWFYYLEPRPRPPSPSYQQATMKKTISPSSGYRSYSTSYFPILFWQKAIVVLLPDPFFTLFRPLYNL